MPTIGERVAVVETEQRTLAAHFEDHEALDQKRHDAVMAGQAEILRLLREKTPGGPSSGGSIDGAVTLSIASGTLNKLVRALVTVLLGGSLSGGAAYAVRMLEAEEDKPSAAVAAPVPPQPSPAPGPVVGPPSEP